MGKKGISRREFLKGTAASALGVAALGLLGGCAAEEKPAAEPCPTPEALANDWLGQEPQIEASSIKETLETEVLIVGAGTGGMFAACSAAENGAKVLVVEKYPTGGGIRDDLGAINSRYQKEWGTQIDKFDYITEMTHIANGHLDQRLVKLFCEESGETIDWYGDRLAERGVELWHEAGGDDPD